jgi:hypothetical protein
MLLRTEVACAVLETMAAMSTGWATDTPINARNATTVLRRDTAEACMATRYALSSWWLSVRPQAALRSWPGSWHTGIWPV